MEKENESHIAIPKIFYNYSTGKEFERCIDCDRYLLDGEVEYFIEKAVKKYKDFTAEDVIFEYAICASCAETMRKQISKESMAKIESYFSQKVNVMERMQLMQANPNNPQAWMDQCLVKGSDMGDLQEFQLYAHCKGNQLQLSQMPYMISGEALDEIAHLLSDKTRDELDDFMDKHFGPPPELLEPLPRKRVVLI